MRLRTACAMLAMAIVASLPALATPTTSFTSGCTSTQSGLTSTITFDDGTTTDSAGYTTFTGAAFNAGTNPCGSGFLVQNGSSTTVTFSSAVDYIGFAWGTADSYNSVTVYNGQTSLGSWTGSQTNYFNIFANGGPNFTSIVFSSGGCCFETDNFSYQVAAQTAPVPEPGSLALLGSGLMAIGFVRRRIGV